MATIRIKKIQIKRSCRNEAEEALAKSLIDCPLCGKMIKKRFLIEHHTYSHSDIAFLDYKELINIKKKEEIENENVKN